MTKSRFPLRLLFLVVLLPALTALASKAPEKERLPDFDGRTNAAAGRARVASAQETAAANLRQRLPKARVDFDPITGAPRMVSAMDGYLSSPAGKGRAGALAAAGALPSVDTNLVIKAFLQEHQGLFGHGPEVLTNAVVERDYVTRHNGMRTVVWRQQTDGIPVFEAVLVAHTTRNGELINISSGFLPDPRAAAERGVPARAAILAAPPISARAAVVAAGKNVGEAVSEQDIAEVGTAAVGPERRQKFSAAQLPGELTASLVWVPVSRDMLKLCWDVNLFSRSRGEMFRVLVNAQDGTVLLRRCLTRYLSDASYRVYTSDSPSPFSPGHSTPLTTQPPLTNRALVTLPALSTNASKLGWITDGGNETLGNNVDAHTDRNNDNSPDLPRPQGSPFRVFDFSMDLSTQDPTNYSAAAVVQLFYVCNWMHDRLYELGFDEASGNFQTTNFGLGGFGNDPVQADAQDGGGTDNANMSTPSDGSSPRMQMYIFSGPNPRRDGDFDAEIILHEYTHGLSWRLVGGGQALGTVQSDGMGEGWSDFYAIAILSEAGDDVNGCYAAGGYATYQLAGLTQNYYYGIRRYPYSTDLTKNPLTFKDIDPTQASPHTGIPRSPIIGNSASEVHNQGEVWCVTLWEARANLIAKHGGDVGNQLILQLVTDGMKLSPAQPNFLQARDAILQADMVNNGGANLDELWAAFAKRGMGFSASSPASSTSSGVFEAFDLPDDLRISPQGGLDGVGPIGGPFAPGCENYLVSNVGTNPFVWTAWTTQPWVSVSSTGGTMSPGDSNGVNVCFNSLANALGPGVYSAAVIFSNATSGVAQSRAVALDVTPPLILLFPLDTDPGWPRTGEWAFGQPLGLGGASHGGPDPANGFTGTNVFGVNLSGDYFVVFPIPGLPNYVTAGPFDFSGYAGMRLQFQRWLNSDYTPYVYQIIEVSNDGANWTGIYTNGTVEVADSEWTRVWYDISAVADNQSTVYVRWSHRIGSGGAWPYSGWNIDDVAFLGAAPRALSLSMPTNAVESAGTLTGSVQASPAPTNDLLVTLVSSNPLEVVVPASVLIAAGQSNADFSILIVDDTRLDGQQTTVVSASAVQYQSAAQAIAVLDDESAVLTMELPASTAEAAGVVGGTVLVDRTPDADVLVSLSTSDTTEIQVPPSVLIPAGQTSAVFTATVVNDTLIDGPQSATVTAHVPNWTDGADTITVLDNESLNLTVTVPVSAPEYAGVLSNAGQVSLNGTLPTNCLVSLLSSDATGAQVPASATIIAGQLSAFFNLSIVDDVLIDGWQTVTVTASADGFGAGADSIVVLDDETPRVPSNPSPAHLATNVFTSTVLSWTNIGVNLTNDVYFGTNPSPGPAQLLGRTTNSFWNLPPLSPVTTYYWKIVTHHVGTTVGPVWRFTTRELSAGRVAIFGSPPSDWYNADVRNKVFATGLFPTVDAYLVRSGFAVPTLAQLQQYDAVLVYSDTGFNDNVALGNVLADYVDSGGGLVVATFVFWNSGGLSMQGRLVTGNYLPFSTGSQAQPGNLTLVKDDPAHPILEGVNTFNGGTGSYHNSPIVPTNGATLLAHWSNGQPLVAARTTPSGRIAGLNFYPPSNDAMSDFWVSSTDGARLMANALLWASPVVAIANDVAVKLTDAPDPVAIGGDLTYTLTVTNTGPLPATGVFVTNLMPAGTTFVSAGTTNGSFTVSGGLVTFDLGTLAGPGGGTLTVVVSSGGAGALTNEATIIRAEADGYAPNNTARVITTVTTPALTVSDTAANEGDSGTSPIFFSVGLFPPPALPVTVNYATSNGTAQAGIDFLTTNGVLNFSVGQTGAVVEVSVLGNTNAELNKSFYLFLSSPSNAVLSRAVGTGTILDDDQFQIAVFDDPAYVDTGGSVSAESDNEQASLTNLGLAVVTFTNLSLAASTYQRLLIPELEMGDLGANLTSLQRSALSNFVAQGGALIVNGYFGGRAATLLNTVFNWSVSETSVSAASSLNLNAAAGTEFADDPSILPANNATTGLATNTLPAGARRLYVAGSHATVALVEWGAGLVIFLGWDWYDAAPKGAQNGGWLTVLASAALQGKLLPRPVPVANGSALVAESCGPTNGVIDPDELVIVNLGLRNVGNVATTNLAATLLPGGGVISPSGPQSYGALTPLGAVVSNTFSFIATGACGGPLTATLQLQDGPNNLGTASFNFRLGVPTGALVENFDAVTAPTLPAGWTATLTGAGSVWTTTTAQRDTLPNAVFAPDPNTSCDNTLTSPSFFFPTNGGQLSFRHAYSTEACCDAGWLLISINGGAFLDILSAGGSFVTNGYASGFGWAGASANFPSFITTIANLPAAALGQNVRLRWRFTADGSISGVGWYVDTVSLAGNYVCCSAPPTPTIFTQPADLTTVNGGNASFSVLATGYLPLLYQWFKDGSVMAGRTNQSLLLTSVTTNDAADYFVVVSNYLGAVESSKAHLTVIVPDGGTNFGNTTPVAIPASGAAALYPSIINIAGQTGTISKVTVTLSKLSHSFPDDLDILLVGPTGTNVVLMSDAGGPLDLSGATLTLEDSAATWLPDSAQIFAGSYKPSDYVADDTFPAPAPSAPFGANLAVFNGTDPNGQWKLFIADDTTGDSGSLGNGWSLHLVLAATGTPELLPPLMSGGQIQLRFLTVSGQSYTVQYKHELGETNWRDLQTVTGNGGVMTVPYPVYGGSNCFYRLRIP